MRGASQGPRADARVPICGLLLIQGAGNRPLCTEFASLTRLLLKSSIWERQLRKKASHQESGCVLLSAVGWLFMSSH